MATEVILPMLGETMNEGTIIAWSKNEGDPVRPGDVLFSVESDKATLDVEATTAGYLRRILAPAGSTVAVLSVVAHITATLDEVVSAPAPQVAAAPRPAGAAPSKTSDSRSPAGAVASSAPLPAGRLVASPRARRAARQRGLDLTRIAGSGPGGRIIERDLDAAGPAPRLTPVAERVAGDLKLDLAAVLGTGPRGRITRRDLETAARTAPTPSAAAAPLTRTQRIMAERMAASFSTAPHFYLHAEVNARRLLAMRQELLPILEASHGLRVTISDLLVLICARALTRHPHAMAQYTPDGLRPAPAVNIGLAADTPNGLVVPVIHAADRLTLPELVKTRTELVERARAGKSLPQDFDGGVFTLSNLGASRVDSFDAILNPPQATILAVGRITERPFAEARQLGLVPTMKLSLSVDHRVLDGAAGARFLDEIVGLLESPAQTLA
ncbi:MAG: 2-oxo acid dehydrogenase subunit E2 [Anaerolineales bacterium]|nr:2-oxo acid dehydrogenase subunit E2 [Anaerolineales bacterium]